MASTEKAKTKRPLKYAWPAIGNEQAIEFLDRSLSSQTLAQTYIFIGPKDLGKATIAFSFAKHLQGESEGFNSDLHLLAPEADSKIISTEQVREFIKKLSLGSFLNNYQVGIIKQADRLQSNAKSALLKTLEEPRDKVIIILLVENEENLPATILSRGQKIYFQPVATSTIYDYLVKEKQVDRRMAKSLAGLALGKPLKALQWLSDKSAYQDYLDLARDFLSYFSLAISERLAHLAKNFSDKSFSQSAQAEAEQRLALLEGLTRDLLLLNFNQPDYLQHIVLLEELKEAFNHLPPLESERVAYLNQCLESILQARKSLANNVNPLLVLEQLVINL